MYNPSYNTCNTIAQNNVLIYGNTKIQSYSAYTILNNTKCSTVFTCNVMFCILKVNGQVLKKQFKLKILLKVKLVFVQVKKKKKTLFAHP